MVAKSAITAVVVVASRRANHRRVAERSAHAAMCNAAGAAVLITSLRRIRGRTAVLARYLASASGSASGSGSGSAVGSGSASW